MNKLVVIGLDGGTDTVLNLPDANCPALQRLRTEGASGTLWSTQPPVTAAAWPSLATGMRPGRHGIFDFQRIPFDRYPDEAIPDAALSLGAARFHDSRSWRGKAFWDLVGDQTKVAVLGVPMTYPVWPVNGVMVAGFPVPDYTRHHAYPPDISLQDGPVLEGVEFQRDLSAKEIATLCRELIQRQCNIASAFIEDSSVDVVFAVFQPIDFAQHRLWRYLSIPGDPLRESLLDLYRAVDAFVGGISQSLPSANVMVVSDHGFHQAPSRAFHTNFVLAEAGLLVHGAGGKPSPLRQAVEWGSSQIRHHDSPRAVARRVLSALPGGAEALLKGRPESTALVDWARTAAYRVHLTPPLEGVLVNLQGRQPAGLVPVAAYEETRDRVITALLDAVDPDSGRKVVRWARRREDVYTGEYVSSAPDVIVSLSSEYQGGAGVDRLASHRGQALLAKFSGAHAPDGIVRMAGPDICKGVDLGDVDIVDVAPTIMALLGLSSGSALDGVPMSSALKPAGVLRSGDGVATPTPVGDSENAPVLTPEEEATLTQSLKALGYIE